MTKEERMKQINEEMELLANDPIFDSPDVTSDEDWEKFTKVNEQMQTLSDELLDILDEVVSEAERGSL